VRVARVVVTRHFLPLFGVTPLPGRLFTEENERLGAEASCVPTPQIDAPFPQHLRARNAVRPRHTRSAPWRVHAKPLQPCREFQRHVGFS
jgi:hypothetical protein